MRTTCRRFSWQQKAYITRRGRRSGEPQECSNRRVADQRRATLSRVISGLPVIHPKLRLHSAAMMSVSIILHRSAVKRTLRAHTPAIFIQQRMRGIRLAGSTIALGIERLSHTQKRTWCRGAGLLPSEPCRPLSRARCRSRAAHPAQGRPFRHKSRRRQRRGVH